MKLIYVCGPYRSPHPWQKEQNVRKAEDVAQLLAVAGYFPVVPHSNTRPYFEGIQSDEFWLEGTMELMKRCDGIALVEGWDNSVGAMLEYSAALDLGKTIYDTQSIKARQAIDVREREHNNSMESNDDE